MTHQLNKRPFQFHVSNSRCLFLHFRTISGNVVKVSEIPFNIVFLNELFHGFPEWFLYNMVYVLCVNRQTPACVILDHVIVKFTTDIARKRAVAYLKKDVHCEHHAWCRLRDPACVMLDHVIVKFTTDIARKRAVAYLKKDVHCEHHAWFRLRDPACVILDHPGRPRDSKVYHRYCAQTCCYIFLKKMYMVKTNCWTNCFSERKQLQLLL